jgi:hypothetical protein
MIPARLTTCVCLLLMAAMPVCAQQIYKWTDANGQVHFSDQPPPSDSSSEPAGKVQKPEQPKPAVEDAKAPAKPPGQQADQKKSDKR